MTTYFYKNIPEYQMAGFCAVRDPVDNFSNFLKLIEIINSHPDLRIDNDKQGFDIAIFTGDYKRALIKKSDGFFSMSIPFQIIDQGEIISFNCDFVEENVGGAFISIMRNAINTTRDNPYSYDDLMLSITENFGMDFSSAIKYCDAFTYLISEDHGYFRFDDDEANQNGSIHPRFHFDIFYKNTTSIKIGYSELVDIDCFYSLCDATLPKRYLSQGG